MSDGTSLLANDPRRMVSLPSRIFIAFEQNA